jgi:hypothetical protein
LGIAFQANVLLSTSNAHHQLILKMKLLCYRSIMALIRDW